MAEVYKAYQPGLDRYVAVKVLHHFLANEEDFLTRFRREARIVATFRHPNIVQVHDFDFDAQDNVYYMVMEFIDGPSLKERLQEMAQKGQTLPLEEAVDIVIAVANALEYAHQQGMVHRDIKPANIIITQDNHVILTDFGIAKIVNTTALTATGAMVGTPACMAPEQGMGQAGDERADIYSLGVVLYQLVTGQLPFDADTPLAIVLKHINEPLIPPTTLNPDLPPGIEMVITRALAKDPNNRYQTAKEFAVDLERAMAGDPIEPISPEIAMTPATPGATVVALPATSPPSTVQSVHPTRRWIAILAVVLVLMLISCVALVVTRTPDRLLAALLSQVGTPTPVVIGTPTSTPTPNLTAIYNVEETEFAIRMATYEATTGVTPSPSSTPIPTSTPTPTPDLTAAAIAACEFDLEVVSDPVVSPSVLRPGQQFVKLWEVENTGTCAWPEDAELVFVSGDELQVVEAPEIEPLAPEETSEIEIALRAPTGYDRYTSVWQLQDGQGSPIGEELEITCRVGPAPTPRPTATPTGTPTPEFTPTPAEPLWMSVPGLAWCDESGARGRIEWGRGGGPSEEWRYFYGWVFPESELPGPYHDFSGFPRVETYFTTSGTLPWPVPDNCCPGDYGRYVSPEGYEIVWQKVWYSAANCPP